MSLINDALKKVGGSNSKNSQKPFNFAQPVYRFDRPRRLTTIYIICGIALSIASIVLIFVWLKNNQQASQQSLKSLIIADRPKPATDKITAQQPEMGSFASIASNKDIEKTNQTVSIDFEERKTTNADLPTLTDSNSDSTEIKKPLSSGQTLSPSSLSDNSEEYSKKTESKQTGAREIILARSAEKTSPLKILPIQFPEIKINGIFYQKIKPSAIINGKPAFIGDEIDGVKVISIEPESVTVQYKGEIRVVKM